MTRQVTLVRPPPGAGTKCPDPYGHCLDQGPIEVPADRRRGYHAMVSRFRHPSRTAVGQHAVARS